MKYTRYDYRRKKNDKVSVVVVFLSMLLAAVLIGTALSSLFLKKSPNIGQIDGKNTEVTENSTQNNQIVENREDQSAAVKEDISTKVEEPSDASAPKSTFSFVLVQNGYYKNKANASEQKEKYTAEVSPFVIEDSGAFRVFYGIFNEAEYEGIAKMLAEKELPKAKVSYEVNAEDQTTVAICKIMKGHLEHLTKLTEENVTAVKTVKFKEWLAGLSQVDEESENKAILEVYKKYINDLPVEIKKDKAEENYLYIYNIISKIGHKK